ncbi:hypothetical protein QYF61_009456 [Mycteria americana]|uniref:Uncharacterized protein n=1 Tax=Mycteria americana TaxID=33587 RepID=A0AAN7NS90_MYCAM|nr:hypothetical protein QYF61_009456 [Mycteria americana]
MWKSSLHWEMYISFQDQGTFSWMMCSAMEINPTCGNALIQDSQHITVATEKMPVCFAQRQALQLNQATNPCRYKSLLDTRRNLGSKSEHIVTWLLRCWDNGASSLELEGKEAKHLGCLPREGGIDKATGKEAQALSLWRQLLSGMKERYPFKEDVIYRPGKWTTMERGIQYLRALAMLEVICGDLDNKPDENNEPDNESKIQMKSGARNPCGRSW